MRASRSRSSDRSEVNSSVQYQGGKSRLAPRFAPVLRDALELSGVFVEPFVGGFNIVPALRRAGARLERIVCNDAHPGLAVLYSSVRDGWLPPAAVSEAEYARLRAECKWDKPETAFAAFGLSFAAKEWGGYARNQRGDDFCGQARRGLLKKRQDMQGVDFVVGDYRELSIPDGAVVYLDPPYAGTTGYSAGVGKDFLQWSERIAERCSVFLSEFFVPPGWHASWKYERRIHFGSRAGVTEFLSTPG